MAVCSFGTPTFDIKGGTLYVSETFTQEKL